MQATSLSICSVHTSNTHAIPVRFLPRSSLQLGDWRFLSGNSWKRTVAAIASSRAPCCPYLVHRRLTAFVWDLAINAPHSSPKVAAAAPISTEYLPLFRSFHKKAPFRMFSVRGECERTAARCLKKWEWFFLAGSLCAKSTSPDGPLWCTFRTCLFWVPSNDSQRSRSQASSARSHLHIWWLLLSYSGKLKERWWEDRKRSSKARSTEKATGDQ